MRKNNYKFNYSSKNNIMFHHSLDKAKKNGSLDYVAQTHALYEIMLVISGYVYHTIKGETYSVGPGDIVLVNIHDLHALKIDTSTDYERIVLLFPNEIIPKYQDFDLLNAFNNADTFGHIIPKEFVSNSKLKNILEDCKNICKLNNLFKDALLTSNLIKLLVEMNKTITEMQMHKKHKKVTTISVDKFLKPCADFINKNIEKNICVADIANFVNISESHLYHIFKKQLGISPHDYLINQKMQYAAYCLNSGMTAQQISDKLNYLYYSTFFNQFKKFFGVTPTDYLHNRVVIKNQNENDSIHSNIKL